MASSTSMYVSNITSYVRRSSVTNDVNTESKYIYDGPFDKKNSHNNYYLHSSCFNDGIMHGNMCIWTSLFKTF